MSARPKISEFQYFANEGSILSALAIICIDNPMVAATGNRICNDQVQNLVYFKIKNPLTSQALNPRRWLMFLILLSVLKFIRYLLNGIHLNSIIIYLDLLQEKNSYKWPWPIWFYICSLLTPSRTHSSCNRWLKN